MSNFDESTVNKIKRLEREVERLKVNSEKALPDGWIPVSSTWTYASATTITVPSGAASIYSVGDKFKLIANGVVKQGYIISVADTLLGTIGDALTNHTFSAVSYSHETSPLGFTHNFAYTPSGVAASNVTKQGRFSLIGRKCFVEMLITFQGAITFTTMPGLPIPASAAKLFASGLYELSGVGGYYDGDVGQFPNGVYPTVAASATTVKVSRTSDGAAMSATVPITWANGDALTLTFNYEI